jgi:electron transfer flavoprotein alpha subunit
MTKILTYIEQRNGEIKRASLEALSFSKKIANDLNGEVIAVSIGKSIKEVDKLKKFGASKFYFFKSDELNYYSPSAFSKLLSDFAIEINADILIFSNTALGKDLSPRVAAKLNAGIGVDCVNVNIVDGEIIYTRPIFAGKALIDCKFKTKTKVLTLRTNVFPLIENESSNFEVVEKEASNLDLRVKTIEEVKNTGKLDVAEADIIVSGGRGLKGPENFKMLEELAEVLGAAVGASRAVVDAGWRPHSEQVGQTGKTVSPSLYVAVGISGAIQHLAGMRSSKCIVAINKDKDAPIFQVADYGIVGDAFEIVPKLIVEIKKLKN